MRWVDALEAIASSFVDLQALDITYCGYSPSGGDSFEEHHAYEALLTPIAKMKKLRYLGIEFLGLDGGVSHSHTSAASTEPLRMALRELPDLRLLSVGPRKHRCASTTVAAAAAAVWD